MILMTGCLLEELTDGKIKALSHRVLDIKSDRFSAPFIFNPSYVKHIIVLSNFVYKIEFILVLIGQLFLPFRFTFSCDILTFSLIRK